MSFIGDRYEIMASWILNPRQMWRGRDLTSYLQEESLALPRYTWTYTPVSSQIEKNLDNIQTNEKAVNALSALTWQPVPNLWAASLNFGKRVLNQKHLPGYTFQFPSDLPYNERPSVRRLYREPYGEDFRIQFRRNLNWPRMTNTLSLENTTLAHFIATNLQEYSAPNWGKVRGAFVGGRWYATSRADMKCRTSAFTLNPNNSDILLLTSLPNFLVNRSKIKSEFPVPTEVGNIGNLDLPESGDSVDDFFDTDTDPTEQPMFYKMMPKTLINPSWLKIIGWTDLFSNSLSPSEVSSHQCQYCSGGEMYCRECEEGWVECGECGGDYYWNCDQCSEGWVECGSCDGGGQRLCDDCDGTGEVWCTMCENEGTNDCEACNGTASLTECPDCEGTGWEGGSANEAQDNECEECAGEGETSPYDCPSCEEGQVRCEYGCNEEGQVDCDECDGDGEITCSQCDGEGGESCEEYGCYDGTITCEYCDEGGYQCGECDGNWESGKCTNLAFEELFNETVTTAITRLQPKFFSRIQSQTTGATSLETPLRRPDLLQTLLDRVRPVTTPDGPFNLLEEVYGAGVRFEFLTMAEIWRRFLAVMKQNSQSTTYFFYPTEFSINLGVATSYTTDDYEIQLAKLNYDTTSSMPLFQGWGETSRYHNGTGQVTNHQRVDLVAVSSSELAKTPNLSDFKYGEGFKRKFNINISADDIPYWNLFWTHYGEGIVGLNNLETLNVSADFKFLFASSQYGSLIRALNYPKG